jgi:hypothetical protein
MSRKRGRPSKLKLSVKVSDDYNRYHREYRKVKKTTKKETKSKPKPGTPEWMAYLRSCRGKKKKRSK